MLHPSSFAHPNGKMNFNLKSLFFFSNRLIPLMPYFLALAMLFFLGSHFISMVHTFFSISNLFYCMCVYIQLVMDFKMANIENMLSQKIIRSYIFLGWRETQRWGLGTGKMYPIFTRARTQSRVGQNRFDHKNLHKVVLIVFVALRVHRCTKRRRTVHNLIGLIWTFQAPLRNVQTDAFFFSFLFIRFLCVCHFSYATAFSFYTCFLLYTFEKRSFSCLPLIAFY